ncbi:unnamed protein product [Owenia fusiformis]|uniref:SMB domain-containing protein n=1 Tax=Owenia fusiformis TaxID=6347 RepID=A0A8S4NLE9_OWEFU|nr:unnamed protein product [Owenia fusiformis]
MTFWKRNVFLSFLLLLSLMKTPLIFINCKINNSKVNIKVRIIQNETDFTTPIPEKNLKFEQNEIVVNKSRNREPNDSNEKNATTTKKTIAEFTERATNESLNEGYGNESNSDEKIEINPTSAPNSDIKTNEDTNSCGLVNISMYHDCVENTCEGKCGETNNYTTPDWFCSCDHDCIIYKDCCRDFFDICINISSLSTETPTGISSDDTLTCKYISNRQNIYMKQSCQPGYTNLDIMNKCYNSDGIQGMIPMTDTTSMIVYANHFCALCNNATHVEPWRMNVAVQSPMSLTSSHDVYMPDIISYLLDVSTAIKRKVGVYELQSSHNISFRQCLQVSKTICHIQCMDTTAKTLCETGEFDPQYTRAGMDLFVRNKHCLRCEGRNKCLGNIKKDSLEINLSLFSYNILVDSVSSSGFDIKLEGNFGIGDLNSEVKYSTSEATFLTCGRHFTFLNGKCTIQKQLVFVACLLPMKCNITQHDVIETSDSIKEEFDIIGVISISKKKYENLPMHLAVGFWVPVNHDTETLTEWASLFDVRTNLMVKNLSFVQFSQNQYCSYEIMYSSDSQATAELTTHQPSHNNSVSSMTLRGLVFYLLFLTQF